MIIAASGGIDSTVLAYDHAEKHGVANLILVHINLGTPATKAGKACVEKLATKLDCDAIFHDLQPDSFTRHFCVYYQDNQEERDHRILEGRPFDFTSDSITLSERYIPGAYTMMWVAIGAIAKSLGVGTVQIGLIQSDPKREVSIPTDVEPEFIDSLNALGVAIWGLQPPLLVAPYRNVQKADVVRRGRELQVPFEDTLSCDIHPPCGVCWECIARDEALRIT